MPRVRARDAARSREGSGRKGGRREVERDGGKERERKRKSVDEDERERKTGKMRVEEERAPLAWRTMGFSCILLIFPKVRGGSLAVCSARA